MVRHHLRGRWRSVQMRHGKPFVTDAGITMMLLLSAANWDTHEMVQKPWLTHCWQPSFKVSKFILIQLSRDESRLPLLGSVSVRSFTCKIEWKSLPRDGQGYTAILHSLAEGRKQRPQVQCTQLHDLCKLCIQYMITVFAYCIGWLHHLYFASVHAWMSNYMCENCTPYHSFR